MNASRWPVSEEEYHSDEFHESNSRLSVFRESVPLYHAMFIEQSVGKKATKTMDFGTAFHYALLQPDDYPKVVKVGPDINKNTTEYKAWRKEHEHHIVIDKKQEDAVQRMLQSLTRHKKSIALMNSPGKAEQAIRWQHAKTGIWCKCKIDYLLENPAIVDIKCCSNSNPAEFSRSCGQLDYHCQAAFYKDAVYDLTGIEADFIHIAVGMEPPYECLVYKLDKEAIDTGREMNEQTLRRLKDCRDSDVWDSEYADRIVELSLPRWAFNRSTAVG